MPGDRYGRSGRRPQPTPFRSPVAGTRLHRFPDYRPEVAVTSITACAASPLPAPRRAARTCLSRPRREPVRRSRSSRPYRRSSGTSAAAAGAKAAAAPLPYASSGPTYPRRAGTIAGSIAGAGRRSPGGSCRTAAATSVRTVRPPRPSRRGFSSVRRKRTTRRSSKSSVAASSSTVPTSTAPPTR
jgi:hypothetical protein